MTKNEIKQELRRSACEDEYPWDQVSDVVWEWLRDGVFIQGNQAMYDLGDDIRIFFLLVSEAL